MQGFLSSSARKNLKGYERMATLQAKANKRLESWRLMLSCQDRYERTVREIDRLYQHPSRKNLALAKIHTLRHCLGKLDDRDTMQLNWSIEDLQERFEAIEPSLPKQHLRVMTSC